MIGQPIRFTVAGPAWWQRIAQVWELIAAAFAVLYALAFGALLLLTRRSTWAFRVLSDAAWAKWLTWPFFFLRHVPAVQVWVLEPWFQEVRRTTRRDVRYLDPLVSAAEGRRDIGSALLGRLRDAPRLWLWGRSGMGKSSVFAAWERVYFAAEEAPTLAAAARRHGFVLVQLRVRHYAGLPPPDAGRPESWVVEAVRRRLEQFGFVTRDLGLIEAMLRGGHVALALDGANEADRDAAIAAFARQFPQVRLLVTSQAAAREGWETWGLPEDVAGLREGLLRLWLGAEAGDVLARRVVAEGIVEAVVSGYDLRLLADLARVDPERAPLPASRTALYRAMLARTIDAAGQPLRPEGLKQVAWAMVTQRRREITAEDEKVLGAGTLAALARQDVPIVRQVGTTYEFRHDQMRAFLAALWLTEEAPTPRAMERAIEGAQAFDLSRRDQEELWRFVASLVPSDDGLTALWRFAAGEPAERGALLAALQAEADARGVVLVRNPRTLSSETA